MTESKFELVKRFQLARRVEHMSEIVRYTDLKRILSEASEGDDVCRVNTVAGRREIDVFVANPHYLKDLGLEGVPHMNLVASQLAHGGVSRWMSYASTYNQILFVSRRDRDKHEGRKTEAVIISADEVFSALNDINP